MDNGQGFLDTDLVTVENKWFLDIHPASVDNGWRILDTDPGPIGNWHMVLSVLLSVVLGSSWKEI